MTLNPLIQLVPNSGFDPAGDLSGWQIVTFPTPTIPAIWNSSTLLPANGSSGSIPFATFNSYTPSPFTAPSAGAPAGNAAYVCSWQLGSFASAVFDLPSTVAGLRYTVTAYVAGNPASSASVKWYYGIWVTTGDGSVGTSGLVNALTQFDPATGWQAISFTYIADATGGSVALQIIGGGTDGTLAFQSTTITGDSLTEPLLIGGVTVSYQSLGGRAFPTQALPVGTSIGSVMSGGDSRIPRLDNVYRLRPQEERHEFELAAALASGSAPVSIVPTKPIFVSPRGCFLTKVVVNAELLTTNAKAVLDFTVNGASIFQTTNPANLPTILGGSGTAGFNVPAYQSTPNFYIGPSTFGGTQVVMLGAHILSIVGTITNLLITFWVYHP